MTIGIRIFDANENTLQPTLKNILSEIDEGNTLTWSILFLDGIVQPGQEDFFSFTRIINNSKDGILMKWNDLSLISDRFFQIYETIILGCRDVNLLHRYKDRKEMFLTCDIVIYLVDCSFWDIFSKNQKLIEKFKKRFRDTEDIVLEEYE